jgi:hypothetical protein
MCKARDASNHMHPSFIMFRLFVGPSNNELPWTHVCFLGCLLRDDPPSFSSQM